MFIGHYTHTLDSQTLRLIIPSKLRECMTDEELKRGFVAALGLDGCMALYPEAGWRTLTAGRVNMGDLQSRQFQRMFFASAERVHCDAQGRIVLPQRLVQMCGLSGEVEIVGVDDRIEIWPPRRWSDIEASQRVFYEDSAKSFFAGPANAGPAHPAAPPAADSAARYPDPRGMNQG